MWPRSVYLHQVCDHVTNLRADIHFGPTQNIHELLDSKMLARYKNTIKLIWEVGGIGEEGVVIPPLYLDVL